MAAGDQRRDHRDHLRDVLGGTRFDGRPQRAQRRHIVVIGLGGALGERADGLAALLRCGVDLVLDVGDVAGVDDVSLAVDETQQAEEHVEDDDRPRVADMGEVVDRRTAHIHADVLRIDRPELLLPARHGVVED